MAIVCSFCEQENEDGEAVCVRCGVALAKASLPFDDGLEIQLHGSERTSFHLEPPEHEGYVIGRTDEASDYLPDIDLAQYGAREQGVSRRHVAVVRYRGAVHLLDLNSANGTFLNGKRLIPETPYPINVGDSLKLGNMTVAIMPTRK